MQELRRAQGAQGRHPGDRPGSGAGARRPVGFGQVDVPALHQPPRAGQRGPAVCRRRADRLPRAWQQVARDVTARRGQAAPRHRDGVPALQPVPAPHRAGEHHRGAHPGEGRQEEGGADPGTRPARAGRTCGEGRGLPGAAVRRPAAAGGDCPGVGDGPQADAVRRADLGARPRTGRARCSTS